MLSTLALPLAMAAIFTTGALAIHKAARYASQITVLLSAVATGLLMLTMIGGLIQIGGPTGSRSTAKPPARMQANPVTGIGQTKAQARLPAD